MYNCIFYGYITNSQNDQLPVGLIAQLVEHCTGIAEVMASNPVQAWIFFRFQLLNCLSWVYNCDDQTYLHFILRSSNIWNFIYSLVFFIFYGYITNSQNDQLPVGLIAQLVEHCTGIAEVMASNPVQAWIFFRLQFLNCLSWVYNCDDQTYLHFILRSSNIWTFMYSLVLMASLSISPTVFKGKSR